MALFPHFMGHQNAQATEKLMTNFFGIDKEMGASPFTNAKELSCLQGAPNLSPPALIG